MNSEGTYICEERQYVSKAGPGLNFTFKARNLLKKEWLAEKNQPDPVVAVFARNGDREKWEFFDKTEGHSEKTEADFAKSIFIPIGREGIRENTKLMFCVYDTENSRELHDKDRLGWSQNDVGHLIQEGKRHSGEHKFQLSHADTKFNRKLRHGNSQLLVSIDFVEPRAASSHEDFPFGENMFRRRVVRQTVVPYTDKVKVPVITRKVVPCVFQKRMKTTRNVERTEMEVVDQEYTTYEEVDAVRKKMVWVEKKVMKEVTQKEPVTRTKIVKKPVISYKEVNEDVMVMLEGTKTEEIIEYRKDLVTKVRTKEVESWEYYQRKALPTGLKFMLGQTEPRSIEKVDAHGNITSRTDLTVTSKGLTTYTVKDSHLVREHHGEDVDNIPMITAEEAKSLGIDLDAERLGNAARVEASAAQERKTRSSRRAARAADPAPADPAPADPAPADPVQQDPTPAEAAAEEQHSSRKSRRRARRKKRNKQAQEGQEF